MLNALPDTNPPQREPAAGGQPAWPEFDAFLAENKSAGYLLLALTPFHLLISLGICSRLNELAKAPRVLLVLDKYLHASPLVSLLRFPHVVLTNDTARRDTPFSGLFQRYEKLNWMRAGLEHLSTSLAGYRPDVTVVFNDDHYLSQWMLEAFPGAVGVLVDEGIALYKGSTTYAGISRHWPLRKAKEYVYRAALGFRYREYGGQARNPRISVVAARYPDRLPVADWIAKGMTRTVYHLDVDRLISASAAGACGICGTSLQGSFVFLSQPLSEDRLVKPDAEIAFYSELHALLSRYGISLKIKPHPRDSADKLSKLKRCGEVLWDLAGVPLEVVWQDCNAALGIGTFSSSSVLYLREKTSLPVFLMGHLVSEEVGRVAEAIYRSDAIPAVRSWEEFRALLSKLTCANNCGTPREGATAATPSPECSV